MDALLERNFQPALLEGRRRFADAARRLVVSTRRDLAMRLPFEDDEIFLDPRLFAYFTGDEDSAATLDQLLIGRVPVQHRPASVPVRSGPAGDVEVPGVGVLHTTHEMADLQLSSGMSLSADGTEIPSHLEPEQLVPDTEVLISGVSPVLARLFVSPDGMQANVVSDNTETRTSDLRDAFSLLRTCYAEYASIIAATTRRVVLFRSADLNSFAAPKAQGCVMLNTKYGIGRIYHYEDLLHQCGHVAFTTVTLNTDHLLCVPAEAAIGDERDPSGELRTAYVVLHAVVTERLMAEGLLRAVRFASLSHSEVFEACGRLGYILIRYAADLTCLVESGVLTARGIGMSRMLARDLRQMSVESEKLVRGLDFSGQPYNFDFGAFSERNASHFPRYIAMTAGE